jgi:hypothetical protein
MTGGDEHGETICSDGRCRFETRTSNGFRRMNSERIAPLCFYARCLSEYWSILNKPQEDTHVPLVSEFQTLPAFFRFRNKMHIYPSVPTFMVIIVWSLPRTSCPVR